MVADFSNLFVSGLSAVADQYDSFVFDQFGVLHNGTELYPSVLRVLNELKSSGKISLVLTNSGRSASENYDRLEKLGLAGRLFDGVVTSGDAAIQAVLPAYVENHGPRCFNITSASADRLNVSKVRGLVLVDTLEACDFVYLSGMSPGLSTTWENDLLPNLVAKGTPLLCSNPDNVAPGAHGLTVSPGTIAHAYRDQGGNVQLVGKPHPLIYQWVDRRLAALGCKNPLFIGDSFHHDIVGAERAGFDSLLVLTGIHHAEFELGDFNVSLAKLLSEGEFAPTWVAATL
ncbi:TIGR01459 family HAD-type hydrolase [Roseibium sp.]|uniref:TIGR01459 family HAD-type hydrolase n=1 Tax=Roseibium sp. TaxID=1936156 RepID=UPI003B525DFF